MDVLRRNLEIIAGEASREMDGSKGGIALVVAANRV